MVISVLLLKWMTNLATRFFLKEAISRSRRTVNRAKCLSGAGSGITTSTIFSDRQRKADRDTKSSSVVRLKIAERLMHHRRNLGLQRRELRPLPTKFPETAVHRCPALLMHPSNNSDPRILLDLAAVP
jgi:hypothetical protein